jgi:hypothetical protein
LKPLAVAAAQGIAQDARQNGGGTGRQVRGLNRCPGIIGIHDEKKVQGSRLTSKVETTDQRQDERKAQGRREGEAMALNLEPETLNPDVISVQGQLQIAALEKAFSALYSAGVRFVKPEPGPS